jgi:hypothetical protein
LSPPRAALGAAGRPLKKPINAMRKMAALSTAMPNHTAFFGELGFSQLLKSSVRSASWSDSERLAMAHTSAATTALACDRNTERSSHGSAGKNMYPRTRARHTACRVEAASTRPSKRNAHEI